MVTYPSPLPLKDEAFGHWLNGLVDGEAHFGIREQRTARSYYADFTIQLRADDEAILKQTESFLGCGNITPMGHDLRLMSSLDALSGLPTTGKSLTIVATVKDRLHFRIFRRDGQMAVDMDETKLTSKAALTEELRKQLEVLWPRPGLTKNEKSRVIAAFESWPGRSRR